MATHLDLEEQEQIDQLKDFWKQYGNLILSVLVLALAAYAGWAYWQKWQRDKAFEAGSLYEELDRAASANKPDRVKSIFEDIKSRYAGTTYGEQGGLLAAKVLLDAKQTDAARDALRWTADNAKQDEYRAIARLRLAGMLLDAKQYDDALKQLDGLPESFKGLAADRRGDILQAQGKRTEAIAAYREAYAAMDKALEYRRLVQAKLEALGVSVSDSAEGASAKVAS